MRQHIERLAAEIRRDDWQCAEAMLERLELTYGMRAVFELGLRVGQWSYGDALAFAAKDGWCPIHAANPPTDDEK